MELTRKFESLGKDDASIAGGKGASLGEMTGAGIPVPPGFVVLSEAFEYFLAESDLSQEIDAILGRVDRDNIATVEQASESIQALILAAKMPENIAKEIEDNFSELGARYVAVRSSATAEDGAENAWAGQLDSYLNTDEGNLYRNIQRCWASLFTPRAIFYRFEKGLHETKISVAVVVQKMVESEMSGIAFSVHPVTEDPNQLIIEAGYGLGEAIVSGQITPDSYVVEKEPRKIIDKNIANQERGIFRKADLLAGGGNDWREIETEKRNLQKLSDKQILELSKIILRIENHYGFPCDIEWAFGDGEFYVVQSRPITTLKPIEPKKISFSKYMSREHSLFYAYVWNDANRDYFDQYIPGTNIKNMAYVITEKGILNVYYEMSELEKVFLNIADGIIENPKVFDKVISDFYLYWGKIFPYVSGRKKIESLLELKEFYHDWTRWWAPMAYVFMIPDQEKIPLYLREKALKVREETQEYSDIGDEIFTDFVNNNYPQHADIATLFTSEEAFFMDNLSSIEIESIKKRKDGCVIVTIHGKSTLINADGVNEFLSNKGAVIEKPQAENSDLIKGSPASPGKVEGRVRLVLLKSDLVSVQNGDVMVTYSTSPDYVPAMKKCSAIVTDEGGIVCHAAIVARELKKPCIIGTKVATQVLHDGDLVEVDADNGVVRVLERAENDNESIDSKKIEFKKSYSRDTTLFMQGLWAKGLIHLAKDKFGWDNPHLPFIAHYVNDGVVEIWEHRKAIDWFLDRLLEKNKANPEFLSDLLIEYKGLLARLKDLHAKKFLVDQEDLQSYSELIYCAAFDMTIFFYTGMDERNPETAKNIAVEARKEGDFFADNDVFVRKNISKIGGFSEELAGVVLPEEFGNIPSEDVLVERLKSFLIIDGGNPQLGTLHDFSRSNPQYIFEGNEAMLQTDEIKGQTAYAGVVRGAVRIIKKQSQIQNMKQGDILVSPMTTPDFLPAMKMAAAFVTDEGGITCHAAIVARELKKPCIIGTKVATQVLHDGDMVEVDADNGVVRVLERDSSKSEKFDKDLVDYAKAQTWGCFKNSKRKLLFASLWVNGIRGKMSKIDGDVIANEDIDVNSNSEIILRVFNLKQPQLTDEVVAKHLSDPENVSRYIDKDYELLQKAQKVISMLNDSLAESDSESIISNTLKFIDLYEEMSAYEYFINGLVQGLYNKFKPEDIAHIIEKANKWRNDESIDSSSGILKKVLGFFLEKNGVDISVEEAASYLHIDEFMGFLNKKISKDEILAIVNNRAKYGYISLNFREKKYQNKVLDIRNEQEMREIESLVRSSYSLIEKQKIIGNDIIKGQSVLIKKEIIHGECVVVKQENDLTADLNLHGKILVTTMTTPKFVPYMKNIKGIITDNGGVVCHAAIIARELGIPCIIGTEVATNLLKNGDIVEFDADNGVVRILEKGDGSSNGEEKVFDKTADDYQQLFQLRGNVRFLMSSIFMDAYRDNDPIVISAGGVWRSFMPYEIKNERLKEGLELYKSKEKYESFRKEIADCFSEAENIFDDILKKDMLDKEDVKKYLSIAIACHRLYSKTEFFYTDLAFSEQENNHVIKENFQSFEQLKLEGRNNLNKVLFGNDCYYNLLIRKISSQLNIPASDIAGYGLSELYDIFDGMNISSERMKSRKEAYIMKFEGGDPVVVSGKDAIRIIDRFLAPISKKTDVIRGQIANKGKVTAKAKVFNYTTDNFDDVHRLIDEMEKGQILVADTTSPEIILACRKASAIVTNQGGMMSHAAIVAREMNIPCVVGTDTATELIHDGDTIEVDADNGIVRIIERV